MKHWKWIASTGLVAVLAIAYVAADGSGDRKGERDGFKPGGDRPNPIFELFDTNEDGEITPAEMSSNDAAFNKLDSNQDGVLTAEDFPARRQHRRMSGMLGGRIAQAADIDNSGDVTQAEWQDLVATIQTDADGVIVPESLHEVLGIDHPVGEGPGQGPGPDHAAPTADSLNKLFSKLDRDENGVLENGELQPNRRAPRAERPGRGAPGSRVPMAMADADNSGDVTATEWQKAFAAMDKNGDGVVTKEELGPRGGNRRMRRPPRQN